MADLSETRCVSEFFAGSAHLTRIACIGDSMVYGQGVTPREALPAQLGRLLNAAYPDALVFADNFGESSGNLWHAWPRFKTRAAHARFDGVVFSICQNDVQVFESAAVRYGGVYDAWEGPGWGAARALFADVAGFSAATGMPVIVVFYTRHAGDRPYIDRVAAEMARLGLPFVDALDHFETRAAMPHDVFRASPYDGHPSAAGHEAMARRLAAEFLALLRPAPDGGFLAAPEKRLAGALADLVAGGVPPELALDWAREALEAKIRAGRRGRHESGPAIAAAAEALGPKVAGRAAQWRAARHAHAAAAHQGLRGASLLASFVGAANSLRNLDEMVFLLAGGTGELTAPLSRLFAGGYYEAQGRLDFFSADVAAEVATLVARLESCAALRRALRRNEGAVWQAVDGALSPRRLAAELMRFEDMAQRLESHAQRLLERAPADFGDPDVRRIWAIAFNLAHTTAAYLGQVAQAFAVPDADPVETLPWTVFDVTIEGAPADGPGPRVCGLGVNIDYAEPPRPHLREMQWAGVAAPARRYRFEAPALLLGDVTIGVAQNEPTRPRFLSGATRIAEIRIGHRSAAGDEPIGKIVWRNDGENLPVVAFDRLSLV